LPYKIALKIAQTFRNSHFALFDFFIFLVSPLLAFSIRFDGTSFVSQNLFDIAIITLLFMLIKFVLFFNSGIYRRMWNMASIDELAHLLFVGVLVVSIQIIAVLIIRTFTSPFKEAVPYSIPLLDGILTMFFVASIRFSIRLFQRASERTMSNGDGVKVLIVGAGEAGIQVVSEIQKNPRLQMVPVGFLDDDIRKLGLKIRNLTVLGTRKELVKIILAENVKKLIFAMPTAPGSVLRDLSFQCEDLGVEILTVPGISDLIGGRVSINKLRNIKIEDLLRREEVEIDLEKIRELLKEKVVLVTGAGGSIGSELCRQILTGLPDKLILLGHGENSIFDIEQEMNLRVSRQQVYESNKTEIISKIADITNIKSLSEIFTQYKPTVVFHAAAHKHVPLMEANPQEAILNNVLGTKNLVSLSVEHDIEKFVLISTDKAVNPTSIMGASKRVAEMITLKAAREYGLKFSAVRFGNVLGSRGSVVRTFQRQLKQGGPITLTHPDIKRYFMTIPEAVRLVLESFSIVKGGEIFLLDMGEPIKIIDLARDMIRLAGLQEGSDIQIQFTGLRPGEKLYEELYNEGEEYSKTSHSKITIAKNASEFVHPDLDNWIGLIEEAGYSMSLKEIQTYFMKIIPEYQLGGKKIVVKL